MTGKRDSSVAGAGGILVTGAHRSGTTWVGRVLAASRRAHYVSEPFNPTMDDHVRSQRIGAPKWFMRLDDETAGPYLGDLDAVFGRWWRPRGVAASLHSVGALRCSAGAWRGAFACRLRGGVPIFKDPIALLSAEWLARRYGLRVLVMLRHPAGFVGSVKRHGWRFDFRNLSEQRGLMEGPLSAFAAQIGTMKVNEEIDALQTLGTSPIDFLVMPRMLALFLMMPLLAVYANFLGIFGGMGVASPPGLTDGVRPPDQARLRGAPGRRARLRRPGEPRARRRRRAPRAEPRGLVADPGPQPVR